jgi:spermidine synthase
MAILWQKTSDGTRYEVRTAGRTRRLYTNNVCHSEFNPEKVITGSIWDLLIIPALFYPPEKINRVLVLGVGGGASLLQLHHLVMPKEIVGVELNSIHLYIARRFFNATHDSIKLVEADAVTWLSEYQGEPFDLIIDDLFMAEDHYPARAVAVDAKWISLMLRNLSHTGALVINFVNRDELKQSAWFSNPVTSWQIRSAFLLTTPALDNAVGVFLRKLSDNRTLRTNIMRNMLLEQGLRNKKLRYRIRQLRLVN